MQFDSDQQKQFVLLAVAAYSLPIGQSRTKAMDEMLLSIQDGDVLEPQPVTEPQDDPHRDN